MSCQKLGVTEYTYCSDDSESAGVWGGRGNHNKTAAPVREPNTLLIESTEVHYSPLIRMERFERRSETLEDRGLICARSGIRLSRQVRTTIGVVVVLRPRTDDVRVCHGGNGNSIRFGSVESVQNTERVSAYSRLVRESIRSEWHAHIRGRARTTRIESRRH